MFLRRCSPRKDDKNFVHPCSGSTSDETPQTLVEPRSLIKKFFFYFYMLNYQAIIGLTLLRGVSSELSMVQGWTKKLVESARWARMNKIFIILARRAPSRDIISKVLAAQGW